MAIEAQTGAGAAVAAVLAGIAGVLALAVLGDLADLPAEPVLAGLLALTLLGVLVLALATRSRLVMDHMVAGRGIAPAPNGLATAAQWLTGAIFFGLAGTLFELGQDGLALVLGWSAGFLLIAVLVAPYLHKSGALTVPDFLGRRYGGLMPRLLGVGVVVATSLGLLVAQIQVGATVIERAAAPVAPAFGYAAGVWTVAGLAFVTVIAGGLRSVSWVQAALGVLALVGLLVPAALVAEALGGSALPQLALGETLARIDAAETALGIAPGAATAFTDRGPADPVTGAGGFLALALTAALGTAAAPVLLQRSLATPTVQGARSAAGWALLLVVGVLVTVPAFALLARAELLGAFAAAGGRLPYDAIPPWLLGWPAEMLTICGIGPEDAVVVQGACGADRAGGIAHTDVAYAPEFLLLALFEIAGLGPLAGHLLILGGFAAALASAAGLLHVLAAALSHDIGHRMLEREMTPAGRVALMRVVALLTIAAAGSAALDRSLPLTAVIGGALSLAAGGLFAAILLGIWDRRTTGPGAAAGIVAGFGLTVVYLAGASLGADAVPGTGDEIRWFGLDPAAAGIFGSAVGLAVTWGVSRLTPAPGPETEDFIDEMRVPRGHAIAPIP